MARCGSSTMCDSGIYGPARVCAGILGCADLHHPNAEAVLVRMMRSRNFRGIRAWGPYDDAFKRGLRAMERLGLVCDLAPFVPSPFGPKASPGGDPPHPHGQTTPHSGSCLTQAHGGPVG